MDTGTRCGRTRTIAIGLTALFILAGCAASAPPASWTMASHVPTMAPTTAPTDAATPTAAAQVAWAARPAFVRQDARTEEAYQFALASSQVLAWIPCYCGCGAMGHRSNLDCFVVPGDGRSIRFEEHASYCQICVNEALMAKQLVGQGRTMLQIRNAIDAQFGGNGAPGTDTPMPSA